MRKNSYSTKVRNRVLSQALRLDKLISIMLSNLLKIELSTSITLGNKSSALSFRSKVELLIDLGAINKDSKNKFIKFMEIRNQFAHNISAESFTTCFGAIDGLIHFLKKNYPSATGDKKSTESLLENQYMLLSEDLINHTIAIDKMIKEKNKNYSEILYKSEAFDILIFSAENITKLYLNESKQDSAEYKLAKNIYSLIEGAKSSLYDSMVKIRD